MRVSVLGGSSYLASWFGGVRYWRGIPAGLVAIAVGTAIAWGSNAFGVPMGGMSFGNVTQAVSNFGFALPLPAVPVPGLLLFQGTREARSFFDSRTVAWTGAAIDEFEWTVRF